MTGEYTEEDGKKLIRLARESIEEEFDKNRKVGNERSNANATQLDGKQFLQARGVFVTLTEKEELRGCIGLPYPVKSVKDAVLEAAKSAAFSDPRFPPLDEHEFGKIKIEISILTMPQETDVKNIEIGKDGLICNYLGYSGLLLPQVALEFKMDRIKFLEALCNKAGLPRDAWQDKKFKLWKFQCQIFSE